MKHNLEYLIIIQARLSSTRLPNKVMQIVGNKTILRHVWDAAKEAQRKMACICKVIVAWPERYSDLDENNVLERFKRISTEFPSKYVIRLTSDCPLLCADDITSSVTVFENGPRLYYSNHRDGHDVQIFAVDYLFDSRHTHREHVIADFLTPFTGLSVNTKEDLETVRRIWKTRQY